MRLIDANALADALFDTRKNYPQWVSDVIGNMPEAVVRCKDCKWYDERISMCDNCGLPREQTFFCADGVAKDINVLGKEGR